mgnify:CR=1 FL=1
MAQSKAVLKTFQDLQDAAVQTGNGYLLYMDSPGHIAVRTMNGELACLIELKYADVRFFGGHGELAELIQSVRNNQ